MQHRAYYGRTYGSASQARRREKEKPYRLLDAIRGLSLWHEKKSMEEMESFIDNILARYLEANPLGTLEALGIDPEGFSLDDLWAATIVTLHCEIMCRERTLKRTAPGIYELAKS